MMYHVTLKATEATTMGVNSLKHRVELDLSSLTESQRTYLAKNVNAYNDEAELSHSYLLDSAGNLTPESIQTAMDKEQDDINETFERAVEHAKEMLKILEKDPKHYLGSLFNDYRCQKDKLSAEQNKIKETLLSKVQEFRDKNAAEEKAKLEKEKAEIEEFRAYISPLVDEYENGGERPNWMGNYIGPHDFLDRILAEDKIRDQQKKDAADKRKYDQLTEVVNQYGTDLQKRKWACDMMERKEALHLLWKDTFKEGTPIHTREWKSDSTSAADIEDLYHIEGEIQKLSDEAFVSYEKIKAMYPDFSAELMRELASIHHDFKEDDYIFECHFVRLSKKIGEYDMEADFILEIISC